jgi:hypothetical protein
MAFPTTAVLDTFTATESPDPSWTDNVDGSSYGGLQSTGGIGTPISGDAYDYYNGSTPGPDTEVYATLTAIADSTEVYYRLVSIGTSSVDGYHIRRLDASNLQLRRTDNNIGTLLGASFAQANANGDSVGAEVVGTMHTLYYKSGAGAWTPLGTRTDTTYTAAGRLGLYLPTSGTQVDDFGGGDIVFAEPIIFGVGAITNDVTGGASTAPTPPTHQADDILIACAYNANGDTMSTATAGWSEITEVDGTDNAAWYWARASGAGTSGPTITAAGTDQFAFVFAVRGCSTTGTPYEDATTSGTGSATDSTPNSAEVTTTDTNRLVVAILCQDDNVDFSSGHPPSGWISKANLIDGGGTGAHFAVMSRVQSTADTVAAAEFGTLASAELYGALTLAFVPPGVAAPVTLRLLASTGVGK